MVSLAAALLATGSFAAEPLKPDAVTALLKKVDEQRNATGDITTVNYIEETTKGQKVVREATVYSGTEGRLVLLFTKPKTDRGSGYLRLDRNLFFYDASVAKWDRRTDREQLGGTNLRRSDLGSSSWASDFDGVDEGEETIGTEKVRKLKLTVKEGVEAPFPQVRMWVSADALVLKEEDMASSGKLMRTTVLNKRKTVMHPVKKVNVIVPEEIRIFDEVEKDRITTMLTKQVDLKTIDATVFTKGWFASQAR